MEDGGGLEMEGMGEVEELVTDLVVGVRQRITALLALRRGARVDLEASDFGRQPIIGQFHFIASTINRHRGKEVWRRLSGGKIINSRYLDTQVTGA